VSPHPKFINKLGLLLMGKHRIRLIMSREIKYGIQVQFMSDILEKQKLERDCQ
jgi:hypothetical protein